ncbi:winged helix-turn-helix transcriptional regulator [Candidatus Bathyarchaeota archaeon]|nr:MAG: winged helix-turn-helix transcriptional regulator [Candidatus Bathyarchaeota archaeon]TMI29978.1 MAG: winged helix-turn-helix transcriptional regulator [Candidatus Bathyarchaeota archaeon]
MPQLYENGLNQASKPPCLDRTNPGARQDTIQQRQSQNTQSPRRVEEIHLSEIAKRTKQSYSATERHLRDLADSGIIDERLRTRESLQTQRPKNPMPECSETSSSNGTTNPDRKAAKAQP